MNVGDRIQVPSQRVGQQARQGTVTAVAGSRITVRWDSGGESSLVPAAGSVTVVSRRQEGREAS
jgi:hypothetical protein